MGAEKEFVITKTGIELIIAAHQVTDDVSAIVHKILERKAKINPQAYAQEALSKKLPPEGTIKDHIFSLTVYGFSEKATDLEGYYEMLQAYASGKIE